MPCYLAIARKIKRKQRIDLQLPDDELFQAWFERKLFARFRVRSHASLGKALNAAYMENPIDLAISLSQLVSEWIHAEESKVSKASSNRVRERRNRRIKADSLSS